MIDQTNQIPDNWVSVPLMKVADVVMGQSPDSKFVNDDQIGVSFLQGNAEFSSKYPVPIHWVTVPKKRAKKDDVLISVRAPVGEINLADDDYCIGRGLAAIRFNQTVDSTFGWYLIDFFKSQLNQLAQGSTFEAVNSGDIKELEITITENRTEQRKIAEILTTVDNTIEQTEALIQKYQRIKQGLMQDLLTKGVDENGVIRNEITHHFKDTQTGRIPCEWEVSDLSFLINNITKRWTLRKGWSLPCINLENIDSEIGRLSGYSEAQENESTKTYFQRGDILFGKLRPYLRKFWLAAFDGVCTTEILVFRAKEFIENRFIFYVVQDERFINYTVASSFGTKMPRTSWDIISHYTIGKPKLDEQIRISKILFTVDSQIESIYEELSKLMLIKQGLMQDLLIGKVRVNYG
jgi:type I restriction enzyme S subunit